MQCHRSVPQVSTAIGRSCRSDLLPSLCCQVWTLCSFSPTVSASCAKRLREPIVPESAIPDFGQPCLLALCPPTLLQNLTVLTLSLLVRLCLHLLRYLPLHFLYRSLSPRLRGYLILPVGRPKVPLCSQQLLPELQVWQELLLPLMIQQPLCECFLDFLMHMEDVVFLGSVWLLSWNDEWWYRWIEDVDTQFCVHI